MVMVMDSPACAVATNVYLTPHIFTDWFTGCRFHKSEDKGPDFDKLVGQVGSAVASLSSRAELLGDPVLPVTLSMTSKRLANHTE